MSMSVSRLRESQQHSYTPNEFVYNRLWYFYHSPLHLARIPGQFRFDFVQSKRSTTNFEFTEDIDSRAARSGKQENIQNRSLLRDNSKCFVAEWTFYHCRNCRSRVLWYHLSILTVVSDVLHHVYERRERPNRRSF